MSKPANNEILRFVGSAKRARKLRKRGDHIDWDMTQHCWIWLQAELKCPIRRLQRTMARYQ